MANRNEINQLKILAKRYARANRLPQHKGLNLIAAELEFSHWKALAIEVKRGWLPSAENLATVEAFVRQSHPSFDEKGRHIDRMMSRPVDEPIEKGSIGKHAFRVFEALGDIRMEGDGWRILVGEAQFSQPIVEIEVDHSETSPVNDSIFLAEALAIADEQAVKVRAGIASDWPRRSTKPDANGVVRHPLFGGQATDWFCLHCDGKITGSALAKNLWHCPGCGATPIDIFAERFWLEDSDEEPKPVEISDTNQRPAPKIEIVDSRPKLQLNGKNITLLLRTALLEDATNPGERLGAQLAEIYIDEGNDVCIVLDEDLWPVDKEPEEAQAVAAILGAELELNSTCMTFPFSWPGLGHVTTSTREYTQMMLDAYQEHGIICRENADD